MVRTTSSFGEFGKEAWERCSLQERSQDPWNSKFWNCLPYMKMKRFQLKNNNYIVQHLHPYIENIVRELSKVLDIANIGACKEMHQVFKYVLDTRYLGLWIEPIQGSEQSWELICFSDSDYAGDPD
ncbi:hypothetical protein ACHAXS_000144, partial [Conticribra weissflogii]